MWLIQLSSGEFQKIWFVIENPVISRTWVVKVSNCMAAHPRLCYIRRTIQSSASTNVNNSIAACGMHRRQTPTHWVMHYVNRKPAFQLNSDQVRLKPRIFRLKREKPGEFTFVWDFDANCIVRRGYRWSHCRIVDRRVIDWFNVAATRCLEVGH